MSHRRLPARPALWLCLLALSALPAGAFADDASTVARKAQIEMLRAEVAGQIQLQAYDLLDELVFGWTETPPFALETPVVLADVSVPVGFGSGLQGLIENHFAGLLTQNPKSRVVLAHCPQCTATIVHSGSKGTVVARGVDLPEALSAAGGLSGARHALFLDFEVEGSSLVLRARITGLEPSLPIVHAKTLSTSTSSPALLRSGDQLKSASAARKEYLEALEGRGLMLVPLRFGVRTYAAGSGTTISAPYLWLQGGVELSLTQARSWTGSFSLGVSWLPELHTGWLLQARISRLLSGTVSSLTQPDLYGFVGGSVITISGVGAAAFGSQKPTVEGSAAELLKLDLQETFAGLQVGLELRVKNRIGVAVFLESSPALNDAPAIGNYVDLSLLKFHAFGAEVSFCF